MIEGILLLSMLCIVYLILWQSLKINKNSKQELLKFFRFKTTLTGNAKKQKVLDKNA